MSAPLIVSIPHKLGKAEARRRLQSGLANARTGFGQLLTVHEEVWTGDQLAFRVTALSQTASGLIDVEDTHVRLQVTLPWLLARFARAIVPAVERHGHLLLDKK
jgi:hypothetical protein